MPASPKVRLVDKDGFIINANTLPDQGQSEAQYALPVVLARGVTPTQKFVPIPMTNKNDSSSFDASLIKILDANPNRRYLRIVNNGGYSVELWSADKPAPGDVGQTPLHGEILFPNGFGISETDTCRTSAIYATCSLGNTGLLVMEG